MNYRQVKQKLTKLWPHIQGQDLSNLLSHDWQPVYADEDPEKPRRYPLQSECAKCKATILLGDNTEDSGLWAYKTGNGRWAATNLCEADFEAGFAQDSIISCTETMMRQVLGR